MVMTPVIVPDYGALLNQAYAKRHELMTGSAVSVFVDQNGERVEYTQANAARLETYIKTLENLCGIGGMGSGPMRVFM